MPIRFTPGYGNQVLPLNQHQLPILPDFNAGLNSARLCRIQIDLEKTPRSKRMIFSNNLATG